MARRTHVVAAALLLTIAACIFSTDSCGCVYPPAAAKVFGVVRGPTGTSAAGVSASATAIVQSRMDSREGYLDSARVDLQIP